MRPRTRRLKSLLVVIGTVPLVRPETHAPQQRRPEATQRSGDAIRECPPLCLTKTLAGGGSKRLGVDLHPPSQCSGWAEFARSPRDFLPGPLRQAAAPLVHASCKSGRTLASRDLGCDPLHAPPP